MSEARSEAQQEAKPGGWRTGTGAKIAIALLVVLLVLIVALLGFVYSGAYNVAATRPDTDVEEWLFETTMVHSVQARAKGIAVPDLKDPQKAQMGYWYYKEMCEICHGAPGVPLTEIGKGLMPAAPDLQKAVPRWSEAELFWIVKHGIRMTGMPAWGATHPEDQLWEIVAFLEKFPQLSAKEYEAMGQAADVKPPAHGHQHGEGHAQDHSHAQGDEHRREH